MEHAHLKRRLTAVLLADVVGYSRLMSVDEEGTHIRLADRITQLIEPKIAEHRGRLIRSMGDGLLVEFDSAIDAVRCALAIQSELADRETGVDADRRIRLRIGINTGDVIVDERDIYGHNVNIAARLEGLAEPGEVYVTRGVRDQLEGHPGLSFEDRGERRVKNIKTPIRVYRVERVDERQTLGMYGAAVALGRRLFRRAFVLQTRSSFAVGFALAITAGVTVAALPAWRDQSRLPPRASLIVMPFNNFSDDPAQDYFVDAVTDDLTTDLSRLPGTFVISRATAFTYKGKPADARQVGRDCGVRYLLEGSIRRVGTRVHTNAQLIDTATAAHIWADRFDNEIGDLFELQQVVTGRIAAALDIQLVRAESTRAIAERPASTDGLDLRLRAMGIYISGVTPEHTLAARQLLREAVRLDPYSAEAWAWLADLLASDYLNRWNNTGKAELQEAEQAVRQALAIDANVALTRYAQGFILRSKGQHAEALEAFSEALKINPNFARAYAHKGNQLINLGRHEEAPALVEKAIKLSPRDPSLGIFYWILGRAYFFSGNYYDAIAWLNKSVEARTDVWYNRLYLVSSYALSGNEDGARRKLQEFDKLPQFSGYTLERVRSSEQANPNDNGVVVATRQKFHEGLMRAGLPER